MTSFLAAGPLDPDVIGFTTAIVVFLAVLVVLTKFVWPKIIAGLDERYAKIRDEIDAAEKARHEAQSAQRKFEEKLQQAQAEATATIAAAQATAPPAHRPRPAAGHPRPRPIGAMRAGASPFHGADRRWHHRHSHGEWRG